MYSKIAIAGLPKSNKTLLAQALSYMTDIPVIRNKTMYEWHKIFDFHDSKNLTWKDMFLIAVSSFFERAENETMFDRFISDGASFSELMWLKLNFAQQLERGQRDVVERLEIFCASHAARQYDFIIHAGAAESDDDYVQLYRRYRIPYKIYGTDFPEQSLREIANDLRLPVKYSVENSIYQAKTNLFIND